MRSNAEDFQLIHRSVLSVILLSAPNWLPLPPCKENFTLHLFEKVFPANLISFSCSADHPSLASSSMPSTRSPGREKEDPPSTDAPVPQMEAMVVGNHTPKPRWTYRGPRCLSHRRSHVSLHQDIHPASLNPQGGNVGPTDVSRTGFSGWESRAGPTRGPELGELPSRCQAHAVPRPWLSGWRRPSLAADPLCPPLAWAAGLQF